MGRYPVTNREFNTFLRATDYRPVEARNFLRHWTEGQPPRGQEDHPVVWVSPSDAEAYARWAELRLPTDEEWQWAALGEARGPWPWGRQIRPNHCNQSGTGTSAVSAFPEGASPFGCQDMIGNAWEWVGHELSDDWHHWRLIRGGSYYRPDASIWYAEGGPLPANAHQRFLLMSEGLNRCGTVGFRCASDRPRSSSPAQ